MEYKALSDLPILSTLSDNDIILLSRPDNRTNYYTSYKVRWGDVKERFLEQIREGTDVAFQVPLLSVARVSADQLSVFDQLYLSENTLSSQISTALSYDSSRSALVLRNADGTISSQVSRDDILADMTQDSVLSSVAVSPDATCLIFTFVSRRQAGGGAVRNVIGVPLSAKNALYEFTDGLKVLTSDQANATPSVVVDYDAVYRSFAENGESAMTIPMLSTSGLSATGGFLSGAVLETVSAVSISAGGYDVGETLCSLVSGLSAANDKIVRTLSTHIAQFTLGRGETSAIADIADQLRTDLSIDEWEDGDIIVVKTFIREDRALGSPYEHTAYVYAGGEANAWYAMDGTYSADSVVFGSDLPLYGAYESVGNIRRSDYASCDYVYPAAGKTVKQLFEDMFDRTIEPISGRLPSISNFKLRFTDPEVGKTGNVYYDTLTYNAGTYLCPWDGTHIPTSAFVHLYVDGPNGYKEHTFSANSFSELCSSQLEGGGFVIADDTCITARVRAEYGEGLPAANNKGAMTDVKSPSGEIGWIPSSNTITGYRKYFWGAHQSCDVEISCGNIDILLSCNSTKAAKAGDSFVISISPGDKRAAFAYPAASELNYSVTDNTSHQIVTSAFLPERRVMIGGWTPPDHQEKRLSDQIEYRLFQTYINTGGTGAGNANTYTVTFS